MTNKLKEILIDVFKPRNKGEYIIELDGGQSEQPVFEGVPATQERRNSLYLIKALTERNRKNFGFY